MTVKAFIRTLLPLLGNVKGAGVFNHAIAGDVPRLLEDLRVAGNEDRLQTTDLAAAIEEISSDGDFEAQQSAISRALDLADHMLDAIDLGKVPILQRPVETIASLKTSLVQQASQLGTTFKAPGTLFASATVNASMLCALTAGNTQAEPHAQVIYGLFDQLPDCSFAQREAACTEIIGRIDKIAA